MANEKYEVATVTDFSQSAFKKYAIEVIENRALPDMYDGLKPVARRVLWEMYKMGLTPKHEVVKSARVLGGVMSHWHPHGDSSIYSALITLANQSEPPVYGHGNWGSMTNPNAAASRYTNCRLTDYGMSFVDPDYIAVTPMMPNYDDKEEEPVVLPALLPNMWLNGGSGIAVGLTTDLPAMEPTGIIKLCLKILADEDVSAVDAAKLTRLKPQYGGVLKLSTKEDKAAWVKYWETGFSSVVSSVQYKADPKTRTLHIFGFPDGTNIEKLLEKLSAHPNVASAENATGKDSGDVPCLIEVKLKRAKEFEADVQTLVKLGNVKIHPKTAAVERKHISIDKVEDLQVKLHQTNPLILLKQWCKLRVDLEIRCLTYKINKAEAAINKTEMMIKACLNREIVIDCLKSQDPDTLLAKKLEISLDNAKLILDMQIRRLSVLDEKKLKEQLKEQKANVKQLQTWLKAPKQRVADMLTETLQTIFN